jgi:hypothetical protein
MMKAHFSMGDMPAILAMHVKLVHYKVMVTKRIV